MIFPRHRPFECVVTGLLLIFLAAACRTSLTGNGIQFTDVKVLDVTYLDIREGAPIRIDWRNSSDLAIEYSVKTPQGSFAKIGQLDVAQGTLTQLPLPDMSGCDRTDFRAPTWLSDGHMAYMVECTINYLPRLYMWVYDPMTNQAEPLLKYQLPWPRVGTGGYSWNPTMTRGITGDSDVLVEQLYWFTANGTEQLDLGFTRANSATWSPDGKNIAFMAAPDQGLPRGPARANSYFNLYVADNTMTNLRPVVRFIRDTTRIAWSPDSQWLVFDGWFSDPIKDRGLWIVNVTSGKMQQVALARRLNMPTWSPDGSRIAAIERVGEYPEWQERIVVFDIDLPRE